MKISLTRVKDLISGEKGRKILLVGGIFLLALLLISTLFGEKKESTVSVKTENAAEIEEKLERRLCELISKIEGVGEVSVMVTLDTTTTAVYEKDRKLEESSGNAVGSSSKETEVVLAGSAKQPLLSGSVMPTVRGAAVVCEGAENPLVREKVANTVAKALNIGISRVYVTD